MRANSNLRSRVTVAVVAALAVAAVVIVLVVRENRQQAEHEAAVSDWDTQFASWESDRLAGIGAGVALPDGAVSLSDAVGGTALRPAWPDAADPDSSADSLDEVNTACTALTAYAESVDVAPEPPAPPTDLELTDQDRAPFERGSAALADLRSAVSEPISAIRQFCGTYPALILAHGTTDGAEANQAVADALAVQCPVPTLEATCTATAGAARALGGQSPNMATDQSLWASAVVDSGEVDANAADTGAVETAVAAVVTSHLAGLEQQVDEAVAVFGAELGQ
ncbi:hypothetical protein [Ruania alba]|uniref:hypothetical protein n=1 Tax=Ruania alba TaxID=648782 RepID=UPI001114558A|nr:hypothetical protein [Ruania alba]